MAIEAISGAGMTYQGSASTAQMKTEAQPKVEITENALTAEKIAKDTVTISTKETSGDRSGDGNQQNSQQLAQNSQQLAQNAQIRKAVEDINKSAIKEQSEAIFGIHEATNRVTIKIVDKKSKDVLKEYPAEKTLDMIAKVWEMAGLMVDEKR